MEIAIHYNAERGYEEPALIFARRLFATYDEAIASLALVPVSDDDLAVYLNGRLVHSVTATGRLPKLADLDPAPGNVKQGGCNAAKSGEATLAGEADGAGELGH